MIHKIISLIMILSLFFGSGLSAYAAEASQPVDLVKKLVTQAQYEIKTYGAAKDDTIIQLQNAVRSLGISSGSYGTYSFGSAIRGFGESRNLPRGWSYRVDRPDQRYGEMKPHVHVYNKGGESGAENVDGTASHGSSLAGVPKEIKDKVRNSSDYKKGQQELKKMKEPKAEISAQHLNLSNAKDLIIATGIFITIVGVIFFAPEVLPFVLAGI